MSQLYRTIPIRVKFTDIEQAFWVNQCQHANSLINCAIYHIRQSHYVRLEESGNAFTTYWRGDELRHGWKTYRCNTTYPELDKVLKDNPHCKLKSMNQGYCRLVAKYKQGKFDFYWDSYLDIEDFGNAV